MLDPGGWRETPLQMDIYRNRRRFTRLRLALALTAGLRTTGAFIEPDKNIGKSKQTKECSIE
jgi:hypothetical protein